MSASANRRAIPARTSRASSTSITRTSGHPGPWGTAPAGERPPQNIGAETSSFVRQTDAEQDDVRPAPCGHRDDVAAVADLGHDVHAVGGRRPARRGAKARVVVDEQDAQGHPVIVIAPSVLRRPCPHGRRTEDHTTIR
jgi:hypothetical protein